ncbi:alanine--tRNA ligase [Helicobacter sp. CLO-3]|uniref:alanine--tRNA ligase n=1 Tax=unclassified Helicobacter TaxID=2593540 RepID=UPI0008049528|nr:MULTISPECIES: alanine--tRNA ligase [unclassified Helicobacter]OBV29427.1 alanine--tRNA ligase [Helicobacter sp. CLO-3]OHU84677.1 alanine--tRNA ligase [Helicobacter sp. CLO-3]
MDIRALYLEYFAKRGHKVYESMPLVPDDASLLFTNAGMVQFKDIFTGKVPTPKIPRATSSQLCIRAGGKHNDLENVGYTARHHTLFEMLGNFSFGDYFKREAIAYAWEFVTQILGFDKSLLYVTIHESDDEAYALWCEHIDPSRIKRMGDKDNFWQMGDSGPCGPCSEIYVDQGEKYFHSSEDYFGGEGDRFLEIWNLVFMQFEQKDGVRTPLPRPSIDTGMGLERVIALKEGKINNFDTSLFAPLMKEIETLCAESGNAWRYYEDIELLEVEAGGSGAGANVDLKTFKSTQASFRVIADHARAVAFLLAQGVHFDKEGRGYVLRRILRRAVRHGYLLGVKRAFLYRVVGAVCESMGAHYGYLKERKKAIMEQCKAEEERFFETIESGMKLFENELNSMQNSSLGGANPSLRAQSAKQSKESAKSAESTGAQSQKLFSGEVAFKLYDTYGFPLDLTQDMLRDKGLEVDLGAFEKCMEEQKNRSKASWKGSGDSVKEGDFKALLAEFGENAFVGYENERAEAKILALLDSAFLRVEKLEKGQEGYVLLDSTPFYPESGGPVGDKGTLFHKNSMQNSSLGGICGSLSSSHCDARSSAPHSPNSTQPTNSTQDTRILSGDSNVGRDSSADSSLRAQAKQSKESTKSAESTGADSCQNGLPRSELAPSARNDAQSADSASSAQSLALVLDTKKYFGLNLSKVSVLEPLRVGDEVLACVDSARAEIAKHHSATHLLHLALREILGTHIAQAGSLVEAHRLRFDFSHPKALSHEELRAIERHVNEQILHASAQVCENLPLDEAKARGAMALFGEKYGDVVRVVSFGESIELCGGIHVKNTAEIGSFYITKEGGVSSGVRRIEAVCGRAGYEWGANALETLNQAKENLKAQDLLQAIEKLKVQVKKLSAAKSQASDLKSLEFERVGECKLIIARISDKSAVEIKEAIDRAKNEEQSIAVLLICESGGKISITAGVKNAPIKAGAWVAEIAQILGGKGGGKDDFAAAGGKDISKIDEALQRAKELARSAIAS